MRVSILIPCYNARQWIAQSIQSALGQTWPDKEVIVVDDGSTDGSLDVIRSFGNLIRCESLPHRGGNAARNALWELADGEWLQYLDADDYLFADKIERQLFEVDAASADIIVSPVMVEHWSPAQHPTYTVNDFEAWSDPWTLLIRWILPQTGAALWRRSAIVDVGGWKADQPCCQEHELYLRLLSGRKRFRFGRSAGAVYRLWSDDTVSRRDPLLSLTKRLEVVEACEAWLQANQELTPERRNAISHARLECARSIYPSQPGQAIAVAKRAQHADPTLHLTPAPCFPLPYRLMYHMCGFATTERVASLVQMVRRCWRGGFSKYDR